MPDDTSEQGERLLRPEASEVDHVYQWKEGEDSQDSVDDNDEEQAQWPPASRRPPSRWQRVRISLGRLVTPVFTIMIALAVVMALFMLLTNGSLSMPSLGGGSSDTPKAHLTEKDPVIVLHPEDHIHRGAQKINLSWNITKGRIAPDGVFRDVILINGRSPRLLILYVLPLTSRRIPRPYD